MGLEEGVSFIVLLTMNSDQRVNPPQLDNVLLASPCCLPPSRLMSEVRHYSNGCLEPGRSRIGSDDHNSYHTKKL